MTATSASAPARLRASADIAAVFAARRSRAGRLLVVHARLRGDGDPTRLAVVASRRVGTAVRRNRAKRLLRESARSVAWQPGFDVVVTARAGCPSAHRDDVIADLRDAGLRVGVLDEAAP